jgi:hypothetical protein
LVNDPDSERPAVTAAETTTVAAEPEASEVAADEAPPSMAGIVVFLAVMGLASPFLGLTEPISGLIGLVILFVGIRIAWTMTAGSPVQITGPFNA